MKIFSRPPILGVFILACGLTAFAQCPPEHVCITQADANKIFAKLTELVDAKEAIVKLTAERMQSDAVIASAQKVIADFTALDNTHKMQIAKYENIVALYEKVITMYQSLVDKLEKKIDAPRSAWQKLVSILKTVTVLITGVTIGRGF